MNSSHEALTRRLLKGLTREMATRLTAGALKSAAPSLDRLQHETIACHPDIAVKVCALVRRAG
jgi:hypothetical protein